MPGGNKKPGLLRTVGGGVLRAAPYAIGATAAAYGGRHLIKFAQSPQGRALVMSAVTKAKQYLNRVKNTPKGEPIPEPSKNLAVNIAQLGGPTAVREMYETGLFAKVNFRNSNTRQGFRTLQNASAIQLAGAAGGAAIMATGGGGAGAAAASLTRSGATGNGLRQGAQQAQRILEKFGKTPIQLQAERVAAIRKAVANATRRAPNATQPLMINRAIRQVAKEQGINFGEAVKIAHRLTNISKQQIRKRSRKRPWRP